ncbi:DeoR/GlpR family DNA-binding transcription regulator [Caballeronia sp. KNU42]
MLANKNSLHRRLRIVELVRKRGEVSVDELATAFDVSSVTIRSDLNYLEQQRYLIRAFGKARYVAQRPGENALAALPASATRQAADMAIARMAADFIDDHASVFIGAGLITHKLLPLLADRANLALTLNDIAMVPTVQRFMRCELRLTGGSLDDDSTVLLGPDAERSLSALSLDLVVLEASGIDREGNLLCADPRLAGVFKAALKNAKRIVVVAYQPALRGDGEAFCHLSRLGGLVLDDAIDPPALIMILKAGLVVHLRQEGIIEFRNQWTSVRTSNNSS